MHTRIAKIFLLAALLITMLAQTALAEKATVKDESYNFKQIKSVLIRDVDFSRVDTGSSIIENALNAAYHKKAQQKKVPIISQASLLSKISFQTDKDMDLLAATNYEEYCTLYNENMPNYADAYVEAVVVQYEPEIVHHEAYMSWETRTEYTRVKDRDGNWVDVRHDVLVPVEHPAYDETVFHDNVEFHVYDAKTGKEIYSRQDWRSRSTNDGISMFERICESFFNDFRKEIM